MNLPSALDLEQRKVGARIGADQLCVEFVAAVGDDREGRAAFDDVVVGDDIAVLGDEEAGALRDRARLVAVVAARRLAVIVAAELAEEALHRVIVGQVVEAARRLEHVGAGIGGRLDLGLDANGDDGPGETFSTTSAEPGACGASTRTASAKTGTVPEVSAPAPMAPAMTTEAAAARRRLRRLERELGEVLMGFSVLLARMPKPVGGRSWGAGVASRHPWNREVEAGTLRRHFRRMTFS